MIPGSILGDSCVENLNERNSVSDNSRSKAPKRPWLREEDQLIREYVMDYGARNWTRIASRIPGRHGKQCRERWFNHLDPNINKANWCKD